MAADLVAAADWRDAAAYELLLGAERSAFAWEWLRRDPAYRCAWEHKHGEPFGFGLCAFEDPALWALDARPFWSRSICPAVLRADAVALPSGDVRETFDLARFGGAATVIDARGAGEACEHLLLSNGLRAVRVDILSGTLRAGPATLEWRLAGLESALPQARALDRLLALHRAGGFVGLPQAAERRAPRWILQLRVHDALAVGASHRAFAETLLGTSVGPRWRLNAPDARLRVQRLALAARRLAKAGPAAWF